MDILGINVVRVDDTFVVGNTTFPNKLTLIRELKYRANVSTAEAAASVDAAIVADVIKPVEDVPKVNPKEIIAKAKIIKAEIEE